jgi:trehalose 6-phosphate synthase
MPAGAGGLVAALGPALAATGGLWFGWSGDTGSASTPPRRWADGAVQYATLDLPADEVVAYYEGWCNSTLWPLLHGMPEHALISAGDEETWRVVNSRFARWLLPMLRGADLVWVQDYHLIPLGRALRALGWGGALGYFHHVPVPSVTHWDAIPNADAWRGLLAAYDLVGVQTERDCDRLTAYLGSGGPEVTALAAAVDSEAVLARATEHPADAFAAPRHGRAVVFGLDRLDYTKGVPARFDAFARLISADRGFADRAMLAQWSAPSREGVAAYGAERAQVEAGAAHIGALGGEVDLRLEVLPPALIAAGLRDADVCLVTSIADGMNLVAKEYVAAQRPERPGVLVLSDGCGAAEALRGALIVPSGDTPALAHAIEVGLAMPLDERVRRWESLHATVGAESPERWATTFLDRLQRAVGKRRGRRFVV